MKNRQAIFPGVLAVVLAAIFVVATVSFAKSDNSNSQSDKAASQSKSERVKDFKNFEKPTREKTNAAIHKEKIDEVSGDLIETAENEKNKGQQNREEKTVEKKINNPNVGEQEQIGEKTREEIAEELEEVAEEALEAEEETVEAMGEVEKENRVKKFFIGDDYKNLGQLRSSLVHNRNQIRKLIRISDGTMDEETKASIEEQLGDLVGERERIKEVITNNEGGFSLLGWVFRFLNGYPSESINQTEEDALEDEVGEALSDETAEETPEETAEETPEETTTP